MKENNKKQSVKMDGIDVKERFHEYLLRAKSVSTAKAYISTLDNPVRLFINKVVDEKADSIYSFTTPEQVKQCIDRLNTSKEYVAENVHKHNSMSAALKQYLIFVEKELVTPIKLSVSVGGTVSETINMLPVPTKTVEPEHMLFEYYVTNNDTDEEYDRGQFAVPLNEKQIREVARVMDNNGGFPVEFAIVENVERYVFESILEYYQANCAPDDDDFWDNYMLYVENEMPDWLIAMAEKNVTHKDVDITYYYNKEGVEHSGSAACSLKPVTFWQLVNVAKRGHPGTTDFEFLLSICPNVYEEVRGLVAPHAGEAEFEVREFPYQVLEMSIMDAEQDDVQTEIVDAKTAVPAENQSAEISVVVTVGEREAPIIKTWKHAVDYLRVATSDDWKHKLMPADSHYVILTDIPLPQVAMERIREGHIPRQMEDRWFMYYEDEVIRYFRSWSGENIFNAYCEQVDEENWHIVKVVVNTEAYSNNHRHADEALKYLLELLAHQCGIWLDEQVRILPADVNTTDGTESGDNLPMKDRFKEYLFTEKKDSTAKVYWSMLDHTLRRFIRKEIDAKADSIFSFTTPKKVQACLDRLYAIPTFKQADEQKHRAISAALNLYKNYIEKN